MSPLGTFPLGEAASPLCLALVLLLIDSVDPCIQSPILLVGFMASKLGLDQNSEKDSLPAFEWSMTL